MPSDPACITVKFVGRRPIHDDAPYRRQFPDGQMQWGRCRFVFHDDADRYDWLVAYDEVPPDGVRLACPREHTLQVITEPATIKVYSRAYLAQFAHVLTSQEPYAAPHSGVIRSQPALLWYYGVPLGEGSKHPRPYNDLVAGPSTLKDRAIATVCSNKRMGHTLHRLRYDFTQAAKAALPELDVFGRGVRAINDKAEAMDRYRYHLAIENHLAPHHITEKLTDSFLAGTLPFYFGAPNAGDYFPTDSFIPIDIRRPDEAIATIRRAIDDDAYTQRLDAIKEARRRTLEEHNLFAVLAHHIERLDTGRRGGDGARRAEVESMVAMMRDAYTATGALPAHAGRASS
ncbi:MAG: glycosyltransferase family 10 domain-containing protein, partial [Phycisphaeraceae bacterium]